MSSYILIYENRDNKIHAHGWRIYRSLEALNASLEFYREQDYFTMLIGEKFLHTYHSFEEFLEHIQFVKIDDKTADEMIKAFGSDYFGVVPE